VSERIIRVFPRRTNATPTDEYAFVGNPSLWWPEAEAVHVSVTFTWDLHEAERLADAWTVTGLPVQIGGPATGQRGADFVPGRYLKPGYVISSRGCPNRCWFCSVWKRDGDVRELPIREGWNVTDDNLLACSEDHIRAVFAMLKRQPRRATFTGGLEAARLRAWHADLLTDLKPQRMYFAYDTLADLEPLREAGRILREAGLMRSHRVCCYVLVGYPGDEFDRAEERLREAAALGFFPFAMLWRDHQGLRDQRWAQFQRSWARPQAVGMMI
jgi:hypothetical protein